MNNQTELYITVARFHSLLETAARNGGVWVSAAGGSANAAAGIISRGMGINYSEVHRVIDKVGGPYWYANAYHSGDPDECRFDMRTVAKAAMRVSAT